MDNEKNSFGKLLVYLRQQRQLSQKELAEELHVSSSCVCKWEKGNNLPDLAIYKSISDLFQVSCDELFHPEETLKKLGQSKDESTQKSLSASPISKKHVPLGLLISFVAFIMLMLLICFFLSRTRILEQGYRTDEVWEQVYEIDYISCFEKDSETTDRYADELRAKWATGDLTPTRTDIIKLSFYKGIRKPSAETEPYCTMYLFYYEAK